MTDIPNQQPLVTSPILEYVQALLRRSLTHEQARQERIQDLEQAGHRIIDGGRIDEDRWEIADWRTSKLIASGLGGYLTTVKRRDPDEILIFLENVPEDNPEAEPAGIPATLAVALQEWLRADTPDGDIATDTGWNVADVRRHREYA